MTGDEEHIPQHDRVTRLALAFRGHANRVIDNHISQNTQQTPNNETEDRQIMAYNTGDVTQVNIEKFNGVSGLSVGYFLRNV